MPDGHFKFRRVRKVLCVAGFVLFTASAPAQSLFFTNGVQTWLSLTNTTVTMSNRCELRITDANNPIPGCVIHLNSPDAFFVLQNVRPSVVAASYLSQLRVNGVPAVADNNCRVVQYGVGAVVIPHAASFQPFQVFEGAALYRHIDVARTNTFITGASTWGR